VRSLFVLNESEKLISSASFRSAKVLAISDGNVDGVWVSELCIAWICMFGRVEAA